MELNQINLTTRDHIDLRLVQSIFATVIGVLLLISVTNLYNGFRGRQERVFYQEKISALQQEVKTPGKGDGHPAPPDNEAFQALEARSRSINRLIVRDIFPWTRILDALENALPPEVRIDVFRPSADFLQIDLAGQTASLEELVRFQKQLEESPLFQRVVLLDMDLGGAPEESRLKAAGSAMRFNLSCQLRMDAVMPPGTYGDLWRTMLETENRK